MKINKFFLKQIKEIYEVDQDVRLKCKPGKELPNYLVYVIDIANNYRIRSLVNQYGYPSVETIGNEGMRYFILLMLHQFNDVKTQEDVLKNVDLNLPDKAALIDRIKYNRGEKQIYGTILDYDIEDKDNVNKRREEMSLNSLKEYLEDSKKNTKANLGVRKFDYYKIK